MNTSVQPPFPTTRDYRRSVVNAVVAVTLMTTAAGLAWKMTPRQKLTAVYGALNLEKAIPAHFGDWRLDTSAYGGVVNPQQTALLNKLYSQILSRTYVNSTGERVMLSIAYGEDQRDGLALHYPEVCYPAQGFKLISNRAVTLRVGGREIPARRLETRLGQKRAEPVTYWTTIGTDITQGGADKKIKEILYSLHNHIPDGLLFRVSSINEDSSGAFVTHGKFIAALLDNLSAPHLARIAGHQSDNQEF